jgi:hypothetical protein
VSQWHDSGEKSQIIPYLMKKFDISAVKIQKIPQRDSNPE